MISVDQLIKRVNELREQEAAALANLHAVGGAIQDCQYWIKQAEETKQDSDGPNTNHEE